MTQLNLIDVIDPAGVLGGESHQVLLVAGKAVLFRRADLQAAVQPPTPAPAVEIPRITRSTPPAMPVDRKKPGRKPKAVAAPVPAVKPAAPAVPVEKPRGAYVQERVIEILRTHGPLTTAEVAEHLYPDDHDKTARGQRAFSTLGPMRDRGQLEKRDDPAAGGISKWFLVEGK